MSICISSKESLLFMVMMIWLCHILPYLFLIWVQCLRNWMNWIQNTGKSLSMEWKKLLLKTWITQKKSSTYRKLALLQINKSNLFISTGCSLSDQHILSPINPEYNNWFYQIYEDLHKFFWNCLQIMKFRTKFVKLTKSVFIFWVNW